MLTIARMYARFTLISCVKIYKNLQITRVEPPPMHTSAIRYRISQVRRDISGRPFLVLLGPVELCRTLVGHRRKPQLRDWPMPACERVCWSFAGSGDDSPTSAMGLSRAFTALKAFEPRQSDASPRAHDFGLIRKARLTKKGMNGLCRCGFRRAISRKNY